MALLRIIGSVAYVHKHKRTREHVLDTRANKGILLRYARHTKWYRILMSQSPVHIVETIHIAFTEDLVNYPNLSFSLPDRDGESDFAYYPDINETVSHFSYSEIYPSRHKVRKRRSYPPLNTLSGLQSFIPKTLSIFSTYRFFDISRIRDLRSWFISIFHYYLIIHLSTLTWNCQMFTEKIMFLHLNMNTKNS